jgi:hypothetical protein
VIHAALGSVAATRTPMACCDSISREGTDLSQFSQAYLNKIALHLNKRQRETLILKLLPIDYGVAVTG